MFIQKFALSYFLHQLKAINRHGLHSPFVYRLVDEVIYDFSEKKVYADIEKAFEPQEKLTAADKLLYRLMANHQPQNITIMGESRTADRAILREAVPAAAVKEISITSNWKPETGKHVLFIDAELASITGSSIIENILPEITASTMLVVKNIHQNKRAKALWNVMKGHAHVTVSINLFWLGLVYHRPGQVKEDFLIKF